MTEKEVYDWAESVAVDAIRQQQTDRAQSIASSEAKLAQSAKLGYTGPVNLPEDPNHPIYSMDPTASWGFPDTSKAIPEMTQQERADYGKANCFGSECRKYKGTPVTANEWDRKHPETTARGLMFPMAPAPKLVKHGTQNFWQARGQAQKAPSEVPFLNPYSAEELHNIMPARKYDQYGQIVGNPEIKKAQKKNAHNTSIPALV